MTDSLAGKVQTVLGPVDPESLGPTLTHEHLLIDFTVVHRPPADPAEQPRAQEPVGLSNLGWVRFNWTGNADNLRLDDEQLAVEEAGAFKKAGGGTIVDATTIGIARNPRALARISRATGLHVVMGAGYYIEASLPESVRAESVDRLAARIVDDIQKGADGTPIRAGIIGEIGCSYPWTDTERRTVAAAVAAQRETGAPILIHPGRSERAPLEIIEFIDREGGQLDHVVMGHIERTIFLPETLRETAATGVYLEYDLFGHDSPYYPLAPETYMPGDHQRIEQIQRLIADGYLNRIVVAHDVCSKHRLKAYGGHGFDHLIARVAPWMQARGMSELEVHALLVSNPARMLTFR